MGILAKGEILTKGKELTSEIGYDPMTGLNVEMDTEVPYNGIAYTVFSNGEIESYSYYVNGIEDIQSVEFYSSGKLKTYCDIRNGIGEGKFIEWNEDGIMTYWAEFEAGVKKRFKKWNNQGELIEEKRNLPH